MTRKQFTPDNARRRANRVVVRRRLDAYPVADWIAEEFDDQGSRAWHIATHDEDFPAITRAYFVQDLHRLAREATRRAHATGENQGWIVSTSTSGLSDDELAFSFIRAPFEDCPQPRKAETGQNSAHRVGPARTTEEIQRTDAWQTQATRLYWCHDPVSGSFLGHEVGRLNDCPQCDGQTSRAITTPEPPRDWHPGDPIPEGIS